MDENSERIGPTMEKPTRSPYESVPGMHAAGANADGVEIVRPFEAGEYAERLAAVRKRMAADGLNALVLTAPDSAATEPLDSTSKLARRAAGESWVSAPTSAKAVSFATTKSVMRAVMVSKILSRKAQYSEVVTP